MDQAGGRGLPEGLGVKVDRAIVGIGHAVGMDLVDVVSDLWDEVGDARQQGGHLAAQPLQVLYEVLLIPSRMPPAQAGNTLKSFLDYRQEDSCKITER